MKNRDLALIFGFCAANVQIFMSYNGGATQGSVDDIEKLGKWWSASLGLLGAMDKIGMTVSSTIWGLLLTKFDAKPLLVIGLGTNWIATLLFSVLSNHCAMMAMKLLMGLTEGLQWVWSQSWVMNRTDGTKYNLVFVSISSGSAAIGNLLGTIVAGFSTANGLTYQFAFKVEAVGLIVSWIALILMKRQHLTIGTDPGQADGLSTRECYSPEKVISPGDCLLPALASPARVESCCAKDASVREKLRSLWRNKLFRYSALGYATLQYVSAAFAFQWIRLFMGLWSGLDKNTATGSLILLPGVAGAIGMVSGAFFSITDVTEKKTTLRCLTILQVLEVFCSILAIAGLAMQMLYKLEHDSMTGAPLEENDVIPVVSLRITWGAIFGAIFCASTCQASLIGISTQGEVVGDQTIQTFAVGVQQCLTNFLGYAMGPFVPQLLMACMSTYFDCEPDDPRVCFIGGASALVGTFFALLWTSLAYITARDLDISDKSRHLLEQ